MKQTRNGRSLLFTVNDVPTAKLLLVGFTADEAETILKARRVLPYEQDAKTPSVDARKLWEKIGKPHGSFKDWAAFYIKPKLGQESFAEISAKVTSTKGRPRTDYLLSRDFAASLAMQANTSEGEHIRNYFLLMERAVVRLADYNPIRASQLVATDNALTHATLRIAGDKAKAGIITYFEVKSTATNLERQIKSLASEIITGCPAGEWRETHGRGIRDVLEPVDLNLYRSCYEMLVGLVVAGITADDELIKMVSPMFGNRINAASYLTDCDPCESIAA
jgi:anti-repressor protein